MSACTRTRALPTQTIECVVNQEYSRALPAQSIESVRVNPKYSHRPDVNEMNRDVNSAKSAYSSNKEKAGVYNDSLPGQVNAQWYEIRAQEKLWNAEFESKATCPNVRALRNIESHKGTQLDRLDILKTKLWGAGLFDMVRNHGVYGFYSYFSTGLKNDRLVRQVNDEWTSIKIGEQTKIDKDDDDIDSEYVKRHLGTQSEFRAKKRLEQKAEFNKLRTALCGSGLFETYDKHGLRGVFSCFTTSKK